MRKSFIKILRKSIINYNDEDIKSDNYNNFKISNINIDEVNKGLYKNINYNISNANVTKEIIKVWK